MFDVRCWTFKYFDVTGKLRGFARVPLGLWLFRVACCVLPVLLAGGCALLRTGALAEDPVAGYAASADYAVLAEDGIRGVVRPDENAALLFSVCEQDGGYWVPEHGRREPLRETSRYADRLLMGISGSVDSVPGAWERGQGTSDAGAYSMLRKVHFEGGAAGEFHLSLEREVRLLGRSALGGLVAGGIAEELDVTGYASYTVFSNPGPLPWPSESGLPYIRVEGNVLRDAGTVVLLHVQGGMEDSVVRQSQLWCATNAPALAGRFRGEHESRLVLPMDFVLPRIALLDRAHGRLTLVAYTPPVGVPGARHGNVLRPDPEVVVSALERGDRRWYRVVTAGAALPLATGGNTRHGRQTFHVEGPVALLIPLAARFCRLQEGVVRDLLATLDQAEVLHDSGE